MHVGLPPLPPLLHVDSLLWTDQWEKNVCKIGGI